MFLPSTGFTSDINCWIYWSSYIKTYGFRYTYNSGTNYNPFYQYILGFFAWINASPEKISANIKYLKLITLIFDLIPIALLPHLFSIESKNRFFYPILLMLSPVYLYNTLIWGQVDSIFTTFIFLSYFSIVKNKNVFSILFFMLAINMKTQAIVFLPPLGLVYLLHSNLRFKNVFILILTTVLTQGILVLPFATTSGVISVWNIVAGSVDFYPWVSLNAFNFWHLVLDSNPIETNDGILFGGLSYKRWGLALFFFASALIMTPLLLALIKKYRGIQQKDSKDLEILILGAIPVVFFYFNTQMHERYSHPCLLFLAIYSFRKQNWTMLLLSQISYFLNMEAVMNYFGFNYSIWVFNTKTVALIYSVLVIYILYDIMNQMFKEIKVKGD
ncbi:MAG: hypothetical protein SFY32_00170 [Bacteroidota bacterium]|nr:hypothetical protein [Bacteroidota bacterium]